jgi:hypothetical protein
VLAPGSHWTVVCELFGAGFAFLHLLLLLQEIERYPLRGVRRHRSVLFIGIRGIRFVSLDSRRRPGYPRSPSRPNLAMKVINDECCGNSIFANYCFLTCIYWCGEGSEMSNGAI